MIEQLARRGLHTNYWVLNDEDKLRTIVQTGPIQGVMSDRPSEAMRVFRQETAAAALRDPQAAQVEARSIHEREPNRRGADENQGGRVDLPEDHDREAVSRDLY